MAPTARGGERRHRIEGVVRHDFLLGATSEGRAPREHLVEHAAQTVDVAATIESPLPDDLLRAHVDRSADRQTGVGQLIPSFALGSRERLGDAEIGYQRMRFRKQDVCRFDVSVDHPAPMSIVQRIGYLARDSRRVRDRKRTLSGQPVPERFAIDKGHDEVEQPVDLAGVMERQNVRVLQDGSGLDLAQEALAPEESAEDRVQDLDGYPTVMLEVPGQVHRCHSAAAQEMDAAVGSSLQPVARRERAFELVEWIRRSGWRGSPGQGGRERECR